MKKLDQEQKKKTICITVSRETYEKAKTYINNISGFLNKSLEQAVKFYERKKGISVHYNDIDNCIEHFTDNEELFDFNEEEKWW